MIQIDDDGYETIEIGGVAVRIDLYEAHNTFVALSAANAEATAFHGAIVAWAVARGWPASAMSHRAADRLAAAVADRVAALKKAAPGSPSAG